MASKLIQSLLKETIQELPDDFATKSQSVAPMLLKKGVKPEELEYANLDIPKGKVTKQQLVEAEAQRQDEFYTVQGRGDYYRYSLAPDNPTYQEKILTFKQADGGVPDAGSSGAISPHQRAEIEEAMSDVERYRDLDSEERLDELLEDAGYTGGPIHDFLNKASKPAGSRYTSTHFPDTPNYLMHTRLYDEDFDGTPSRVLLEIQSDLHQQGRQQGYRAPGDNFREVNDLAEEVDEFYASAGQNLESPDRVRQETDFELRAQALGMPEGYDLTDWLSDNSFVYKPPQSPLEKNWLRKGIERELVEAVDEGREQLVIPIKGGVESLHRAPGVQKWYETTVLSTAKKIAKQNNAEFSVVTKSATDLDGTPEDIRGFKAAFKAGDMEEANEYLGLITHDAHVTPAQFVSRHFPELIPTQDLRNLYARIDDDPDMLDAFIDLASDYGMTPDDDPMV